MLAGGQTATSRGPGPGGGPGSSVHRARCFGCLNGRAPCLVECSGAPLPGKWEGVAPAATVSVQPQGRGQRLLACWGHSHAPWGVSELVSARPECVPGKGQVADGGFVSPGPAAVGAPAGLGALPAQTWGQNGRDPLGGWLLGLGSHSPGLSSLQQQRPRPRAWVWQDHVCCSDVSFWAWSFLEVLIQSLITAPVSPHPGDPHPGDPHSR